MKLFNFGACSSSQTTSSIKKEIKSLNKEIKLIKQSRNGGRSAPISSMQLDGRINKVRECASKLQGKIEEI
ncbi:hypothetical protein NTH48_003543 [Vibrio cholerae]